MVTWRKFRPEIQFLRAVAVIAVVIYHINPAWLPGGFVGVDVFFVISGFLITGGILHTIETTGRFSLVGFWANRARRILPAASLTIVVAGLASVWLLPLTRLEDVTAQGVAAALYVQNFMLAFQSVDYLAADAAATPFQHFWSLSLEEQFYLLWPLLVVAAGLIARRVLRVHPTGFYQHRRRLRALTVLFFFGFVVVSFAASVIAVGAGDPTAYFVTWTRLWELGVGGLLACVLIEWRAWPGVRLALQLVGIAAIVASAVLYSGATPFPGVAALLPIGGTVAVIAAGSTEGRGSLGPFIGLVAVQRVGDWSYSLYLWHFPVVVFVAARLGGSLNVVEGAGVLAVSLGLACLSYYLVERPILRWRWLKVHNWQALVATVCVAVMAAGVSLVPGWVSAREARLANLRDDVLAVPAVQLPSKLGPGFGSLRSQDYDMYFGGDTRIQPNPIDARSQEPAFPECSEETPVPMTVEKTPECVIANPDGAKTLAVVGDSHAAQWVPAIREVVKDTDWKVAVYLRQSCTYSVEPMQAEGPDGLHCVDAAKDVLNRLTAAPPDVVVMSSLLRLDPVQKGDEEVPGTSGFEAVFSQLEQAGSQVFVLADSPNPPGDMPECVSGNASDPSTCDFRRSDAHLDEGTNKAIKVAAMLVPGVTFIDTADAFCTESVCPAVVGSRLVYRDTNHVSPAYATTLSDWLADHMGIFDTAN